MGISCLIHCLSHRVNITMNPDERRLTDLITRKRKRFMIIARWLFSLACEARTVFIRKHDWKYLFHITGKDIISVQGGSGTLWLIGEPLLNWTQLKWRVCASATQGIVVSAKEATLYTLCPFTTSQTSISINPFDGQGGEGGSGGGVVGGGGGGGVMGGSEDFSIISHPWQSHWQAFASIQI